jgi:hypothetical protein
MARLPAGSDGIAKFSLGQAVAVVDLTADPCEQAHDKDGDTGDNG